MRLTVVRVVVPAWSTVGIAYGIDAKGNRVRFVGDHRPMRRLGEAVQQSKEPIEVDTEDWQVL